MFWAPVSDGVLWLVIVIIAKILLLDQGRRFLAQPQNQVDVRLWRRRFIMIELLNGSTLAGFALIGVGQQVGAADSAVFSSHVFIFATLILVLAIRVMFAATFTQALLAGTIPMTLAVVVRLLLLADPFYLALGSMAIGILQFVLSIIIAGVFLVGAEGGYRMSRTFASSLAGESGKGLTDLAVATIRSVAKRSSAIDIGADEIALCFVSDSATAC